MNQAVPASEESSLMPLGAFSKNFHSQDGEDGIIEEILKRIERKFPLDRWCVEFGAWDGVHLSNTYHLIKDKQYRAVLVEGDSERHEELCRNIPQEEVIKLCRYVTLDGDSTLEEIMKTTVIPTSFDFLSIDIDGCDFYVFQSLYRYRPKVVCIEFNPSIPNEVEFVQEKSFAVKHGSSARSILLLAQEKGYVLVAVTHTNLIFVRADFVDAVIGSNASSLDELRDDTNLKFFLFVGYDGTVLSNKIDLELPWHNMAQGIESLQMLPKWLRTYPEDYSVLQRILFRLWRALRPVKDFVAVPKRRHSLR